MPNLEAWSHEGVVCRNHHSVFPTATRVNSAAVATGCYPEKNGLLGNSVFFPSLSSTKGLDTGSREVLLRIEEETGGKLLTVPSLGEYLRDCGKNLLAVSSGSSGSCSLLNHKGCGMGLIHAEFVLPESKRDQVVEALGEVPGDVVPNTGQNRWVVDATLKYGFEESSPDVVLLWISDPDHTAHKGGIGSPLTEQALHEVDSEFGRILAALKERDLLKLTNLLVGSDHGFSTYSGGESLKSWLVDNGLKSGPDSDDVVVVGEAIYVKDHDPDRIEAIVTGLQREDWVGAIFTRPKSPGSYEGEIPGTMSFDRARWNHERSADILVSVNWSDEKNENGWPGKTTGGGVAGHGSTSPYDIHNTLIVGGPAFKSGITSEVPTGNVDLAPTLCALLGLDPAPFMQGRVLKELLSDGPAPEMLRTGKKTYWVERQCQDGTYRLELEESTVDDYTYLDFTKVERK
jgi:predicted AlkP superfamily pyrophosphatase or phosphodiesterase